jgi:hypothetical protein
MLCSVMEVGSVDFFVEELKDGDSVILNYFLKPETFANPSGF